MRTFRSIWSKLTENGAAFRKAFVSSQVKRLIPFQIYALRKSRNWSQEELAKRSGLTQGVISRAEDPDYGNLTFNTVISIAGGFDVAFIVKFVPFSELTNWNVDLSEQSVVVPSFSEECSGLALGSIPGIEAAVTQEIPLGTIANLQAKRMRPPVLIGSLAAH